MSDFIQLSDNGPIVNLDHVVSIDRVGDNLRITTAVHGVTLTIKSGSPDERTLLDAIARRILRGVTP